VELALSFIAGKKKFIKTEPVDEVRADGTVMIGGDALHTTGTTRGIQAGDDVEVLYARKMPTKRALGRKAILKHNARRGLVAPPLGGRNGIVEELFINRADRDVWFRNDSVVQPLKVKALLPGLEIESVQWGTSTDAFFVRTTGHVYHVFTMARAANQPQGSSVGTVTLLRTERPWDKAPLLVTLTASIGYTTMLRYATTSTSHHQDTRHHLDIPPSHGTTPDDFYGFPYGDLWNPASAYSTTTHEHTGETGDDLSGWSPDYTARWAQANRFPPRGRGRRAAATWRGAR
jgi:hypothetical protein